METFHIYNFPKEHYNKKLFENLDIQKDDAYSYYGKISNLDKKDIIDFIKSIGNNNNITINKVSSYIMKSIKYMLKKFSDYDSFWFTIRSFIPTDDYKFTRWHSDGKFFRNDRNQYKLVSVPKGPSTLFVEPDEKTRKKFNKKRLEYYKELNENFSKTKFKELNIKYGKKFKKILANNDIKTIKNNQFVEFNVGPWEIGAIHSEPDIVETRLFFSLVLGTEQEIKQLHEAQLNWEKNK